MSTYASRSREFDRAWAQHRNPDRRREPIGAEARGRLRQFKQSFTGPAARISAALASSAYDEAACDFAFKKGKGQARAFDRMYRMLAPCHGGNGE
jgi:hypothetical protein